MPWMNYCKKCKAEVSLGDMCPYCGGKLTKTGERLSFMMLRVPVRDWFAWNQWLRAALPALGLVAAITLITEAFASGSQGIQALFLQGFFWLLVWALGGMLVVMLIVLALQGPENVLFTLDKDGAHAQTYLSKPTDLRLFARFLSREAAGALQQEEQAQAGMTLVRRMDLPWQEIRRVQCWRENRQILFFRPSWWQVLVITCPPGEYEQAEAFVRKKLARNKKVRVLPKAVKRA